MHCTSAVYTDIKTYNYIQRSGSAVHDSDKDMQYRRYMNMLTAANMIRDCIDSIDFSTEIKKISIARAVDDYSGMLRVLSESDDLTTQKMLRKYILDARVSKSSTQYIYSPLTSTR